jgi:tetratricopeptide (TPR) repeat protein
LLLGTSSPSGSSRSGYRKSLAIDEALGNRDGMATSYHQLGRVAQDRGDYDDALEWYRKSLPIFEALGNRTGMASSLSQMGVLLTETGHPTEAIRLNLKSLALRRDLRLPEVRINLHWLDGQREALGQEAFQAARREHLSEEEADAVLRLLDDQAAGDAG